VWLLQIFGVITLLFTVTGCFRSESASTFQKGEPIPLGAFTIEVSYSQVSQVGNAKLIEIFMEWRGLPVDPDLALIQRYAKHMFVIDERGKKFRNIEIIPVTLWNKAKLQGVEQVGVPPDFQYHGQHTQWVYPVKLPLKSSNFTLVIENPDKQKGQPKIAKVQL
jgi:hypothetical protein